MGGQKQDIPKFPKASEEYQKGLQTYLRFLPRELRQEFEYRAEYDPKFLEQALGLQAQFDPRLAQEQLDALKRRDPEWYAMHKGLADKIREGLDRGYLDPQQKAAYDKMMGLAGVVDPRQEAAYQRWSESAGKLDPEQEAAYHKAAALAGKVEPQYQAAYGALGKQVTGDTLRGGTASPETLRQMTQAIMAQRPGLSYGEAQDMATAVYTGQRSEALKAQRQGATGQFLQQRDPTSMRQASLASFYGMPSLEQQRQASLAGFYGAPSTTQQRFASLGQAYGMAPPSAQTLAQAGSFLSSPTVNQMIGQTAGVSPPRQFGYVNPNAGYMGQQFALQNYQNMLGYNQLGGGGGGGNPWVSALQGAGQGASMGGQFGGGYGAAGGAVVGGVLGAFGYPQFSTIRLKRDVKKVGERNGLDIIEFRYRAPRSSLFRGVIAEQVRDRYPDAVGERDGFLTVDYEQIGIPFEKYCGKCQQFKNINDFYPERRLIKRLATHASHCKSCSKKASHRWNTTHLDKKRLVNQGRRKKQRQYERERWRNNPVYKLKCHLRWFLRHHVKGETKIARARELLGCSVEEFKVYLQQKFKDGMAWNNYGKWHIDHIKPCSSFDLLDPEQQRKCFHYTNMQPLWADENRSKYNKIILAHGKEVL